jgi:RHS repeat-associated protein
VGGLDAPLTTFTYDAVGNQTSLTDPVGNTTTWVFDGLDRVIEEENELEDSRYFAYDAANNLIERTDRNGRVIEYVYDNLHQVIEENWIDGMSVVRTFEYTYDLAGQLLTASDPDSSYEYAYDNLGRVTQIDIDNGGPIVVLTQTFDAAGNRTSLAAEVDSTDDFLNTYTYDHLHRMTRVTQEGQSGGNTVAEKRVDFAYNAAGQFTAIDRYKDTSGGSGNLVVETAFAYDLIGRLTDLTHTADTTTIADYHWDYDAFGRITFTSYDFSDGDDGSSTFSYDATGQLIEADHTAQADEEFEFDENGNRTMTGYDTGANNLLLSDGTFNYVYDSEGNRTSRTRISNDPADDKTVEYEWDYRNRLTRVVFKDNSNDVTKEVIYEYDVFNRRITKIIDADGEGVGVAEQTDFIYDGQDIVLALDGEGSLTNRYLHGPAIDQILADEQIAEEQLIWTLADNLGSVRDLVNNAGEVESHIDYTAFGAVETITNNLVQTLYGFTGRERDAETGQTYHRARYYDPLVGRWLSEDPIGFSAGDANIQRYVGNDPVNFRDPHGHEGIGDSIGTWVDNQWEWWNEPIYRPIPRSWKATSLPIRGFDEASIRRFREGDPNYTTSRREVFDDWQMLMLDIASIFIPGAGFYDDVARGGIRGIRSIGTYGDDVARGADDVARGVRGEIDPRAVAEHSKSLKRSPVSTSAGAKSKKPHGNRAGDQPATLYERYDRDGNFQKHGVSQDPAKRYTQKELDGGYLIRTQTGPRKDILRVERDLVETKPGPLNKEKWAGKRSGE